MLIIFAHAPIRTWQLHDCTEEKVIEKIYFQAAIKNKCYIETYQLTVKSPGTVIPVVSGDFISEAALINSHAIGTRISPMRARTRGGGACH